VKKITQRIQKTKLLNLKKHKLKVEHKNANTTKILRFLAICCFGIMLFIFFWNKNDPENAEWADYALMMSGFCAIGFIGYQMLYRQTLFEAQAQVSLTTMLRALIILGACMITQVIGQIAFTISTLEQVLYYVFAAVAEELFFRVFLLSLVIRFKTPPLIKIIAIVLQALIFTIMHRNYYSNLAMMFSVFVGGVILGAFFVWWKDPTANILAHFFLNLIAVQSIIFSL